MAQIHFAGDRQLSKDTEIWNSLQLAIAASSGYKRWEVERKVEEAKFQKLSLEQKVQRYLRETLENLAY